MPTRSSLVFAFFIASGAVCLHAAAQAIDPSPSSDTSATDGELYRAACAACHGSDGRGRGQSELGFSTVVPDFTDCEFATREPDSDWYAIVHEGGTVRAFDRMMPAFGEALSEGEARRILAHIRTICVDESWPRGELNVPKALFTEKAFPEDEAIVRMIFGTDELDYAEQRFTWEQRFGARSQIEVSLPLIRADLGPPRGREGGIGDLSLAFKYALRHSLSQGSIFSVGGELVLPTGDEDRGFGKGTAVLEPYMLFAKLLAGDAFWQFQGKLEFPVEDGFEDELVVRSALGKTWTTNGAFGRAWTPMIELLGARELTSGVDTTWDLVPQFQVTLNTRQHVMANFGVRVPVSDTSAREPEFVVYFLWDWFDGGLLDGW